MSSIKRWGSLFSYVDYESESESEDGIARFSVVVLLKDFNNLRAGTAFDQVEIDVCIGTISFGNFVDCPTSECGKTHEFTAAFEIA